MANIIGLVDCIDLDKSEYEPMIGFPDRIFAFYSMKLDESKIQGLKIFRPEKQTTLVIVDENIKTKLDAAGLKGVKFPDADGFSTF